MSKLAVGQLEGLASEGYRITVASGSAFAPVGSILQVVSVFKDDVFTTTSSSYVDVTGLSVSITPKFSSSKILVLSNLSTFGAVGSSGVQVKIVRGSTSISVGGGGVASSDAGPAVLNSTNSVSIVYLDSPATTSATTYKCQVAANVNGNTVGLNRDTGSNYRTASNIVLLEVAG